MPLRWPTLVLALNFICAPLVGHALETNASPTLRLPARSPKALTGSAFVKLILDELALAREELIFQQIAEGNVPDFLRALVPIPFQTNSVIYATPDYLAVGSNEDYFLTPMRPATAQRIADLADCILPTRKMVDLIYAAAPLKLSPTNLTPDKTITTVPVFAHHNALIQTQSLSQGQPTGFKAGHKKDVVISDRLMMTNGRVAIYGWHRLDGKPIQPLYTGHASSWVDYSHGIRLIAGQAVMNGAMQNISAVLSDPTLAKLLSDEGPIQQVRYPTWVDWAKTFRTNGARPEITNTFLLDPGIRVHINAPILEKDDSGKPVKLLYYALPNGNTIEQSRGKRAQTTNDWRFDNQHIDAQTRFLRSRFTNEILVSIFLEAETKSWPAWRKKYDPQDRLIPGLIRSISARFADFSCRTTLTGHSGGGSLIFGMINAGEAIPAEIERIAFLDATYAFDAAAGHARKLSSWLKASPDHCLTVLAYDDANALLNGKPFVTASGGTWGRTHAMLANLSEEFAFSRSKAGPLGLEKALGGRIQLLLRENPERKIWHTVMVELNGFIHCVAAATPMDSRNYDYMGGRAYESFIAE